MISTPVIFELHIKAGGNFRFPSQSGIRKLIVGTLDKLSLSLGYYVGSHRSFQPLSRWFEELIQWAFLREKLNKIAVISSTEVTLIPGKIRISAIKCTKSTIWLRRTIRELLGWIKTKLIRRKARRDRLLRACILSHQVTNAYHHECTMGRRSRRIRKEIETRTKTGTRGR